MPNSSGRRAAESVAQQKAGVSRKSVSIAENCPLLGQPAASTRESPRPRLPRRCNVYDTANLDERDQTRGRSPDDDTARQGAANVASSSSFPFSVPSLEKLEISVVSRVTRISARLDESPST